MHAENGMPMEIRDLQEQIVSFSKVGSGIQTKSLCLVESAFIQQFTSLATIFNNSIGKVYFSSLTKEIYYIYLSKFVCIFVSELKVAIGTQEG